MWSEHDTHTELFRAVLFSAGVGQDQPLYFIISRKHDINIWRTIGRYSRCETGELSGKSSESCDVCVPQRKRYKFYASRYLQFAYLRRAYEKLIRTKCENENNIVVH